LFCPSTADVEFDLARRQFGFRAEDPEGFACPRGAHIRRANPRDGLGWDMLSGVGASKLHRLIRVGRVYTTAPACGGPDHTCATAGPQDCGAGLFFMALNADFDRQFEFIQQRWIASNKFADLWDEDDPLLGAKAGRCFSAPDYRPVGRRFEGLGQFTKIRAGGYFFLPSLQALEFIGRAPTKVDSNLAYSVPLDD
jgi:putative iron-dependent peroxidase